MKPIRLRHPLTGATWLLDGRTGRTKEVVPATEDWSRKAMTSPAETLREQIARAIYELSPVGVRGWEDAPKSTRERCLICADAALAAIEASGYSLDQRRIDEVDFGKTEGPTEEEWAKMRAWAAAADFRHAVEMVEASGTHVVVPLADNDRRPRR